jgi:NADH dehydrogenase [ubiquinone] 1 alpha subcomplex assembly factor 7
MLAPDVAAAPKGSIAEICPAGFTIAGEIAAAVRAQGGAALIIDYGTVTSAPGDSLQAMAKHEYVDVFKDPGTADITAHVDFAALARAAQTVEKDGAIFGPVTQGRFLHALGITARAAKLKHQASPAKADEIDRALKRLTNEDEMGNLFKLLCLASTNGPIPAGFEEDL